MERLENQHKDHLSNSPHILLLSTYDRRGGAAIGAFRLLKALQKKGMIVRMLVQEKLSDDPAIQCVQNSLPGRILSRYRFYFERLVIFLNNHFSRKQLFKVSLCNTGSEFYNHPWFAEASIIHFQWVNHGLVSLKGIRKALDSGKPVIWTMRDMWLSTAICHYSYDCERFFSECYACPFLNSKRHKDLSNKIWNKKSYISNSSLQVVTVSSWLQGQVKKSAITKSLNTYVIPNMTDISVFKFSDKLESRKKWNLPSDRKIIAMGAVKLNDPIKGFSYLVCALNIIKEKYQSENYFLLLFGSIKNDPHFFDQIPFDFKHVGVINKESEIASLYAAADISVVPSLYETFGKVITESMACGTPVVAFSNSGQRDIIDHMKNGYLANFKDVEDMASGIHWLLEESNHEMCCTESRKKIESHFTEDAIADKYIDLYKKLISNK